MALPTIGRSVAAHRKRLRLSQSALAERARISRPTLAALENGRLRELGFTKLARVLAVLGMELDLREAVARRPTLDQLRDEMMDGLREEERRDQDLDRRS